MSGIVHAARIAHIGRNSPWAYSVEWASGGKIPRRERPFRIDAWVVLPDHLHAVWTLPPGDDDTSTRWRLIKTLFRPWPATPRVAFIHAPAGR
jgi:hypothetical protein